MFEQSIGRRQVCEKVIRPHLRARRTLVDPVIPLPAVVVKLGKGVTLFMVYFAQGGHSLFIPCQPLPHFTRLTHLGWGQCGDGISPSPQESCKIPVVQALLHFFGHPDGAALKLFGSALKPPIFQYHLCFQQANVPANEGWYFQRLRDGRG